MTLAPAPLAPRRPPPRPAMTWPPPPDPDEITPDRQIEEITRCTTDPLYFIATYCHIFDAGADAWIPFHPWPDQVDTLQTIVKNQKIAILKARQLGLTWLCLSYALWLMLYRPAAVILLFSRRETEAAYLLDDRLKGIFERLPDYLKVGIIEEKDNTQEWKLSNGSEARAFPTTAGDSYTATLAIVDEADLIPDLNYLMRGVKPTIDADGQIVLLSRSDKSRPESLFKNIYRAAKAGLNGYAAIFLPWHSRPSRTDAWYRAERTAALAETGTLDDIHEQYPATDAEALAPRSLDKRIPADWLLACYQERQPLRPPPAGSPPIPGLNIYRPPVPGRRYYIGLDPAEGNPTSDDSALSVIDAGTGEQVATLRGKIEMDTLANYAAALAIYYGDPLQPATVLPERNNHGHTVINVLKKDYPSVRIATGHDGKLGWMSSTRGKTLLYNAATEAIRDEQPIIYDFTTYTQLSSIEGNTLRAPENMPDDAADAEALALVLFNNPPPPPAGANVRPTAQQLDKLKAGRRRRRR